MQIFSRLTFNHVMVSLPVAFWSLTSLASKSVILRFGLCKDSLRRWIPGVLVNTFFHTDTFEALVSIIQYIIAVKRDGCVVESVVGGSIGAAVAGFVFARVIPSSLWFVRPAAALDDSAHRPSFTSLARLAYDMRRVVRFVLTLFSLPARPSCALVALMRCGADTSSSAVVLCGGSSLNAAIRGYQSVSYRCADDFIHYGALALLSFFAERNDSRLATLFPLYCYLGGASMAWAVSLWNGYVTPLLTAKPLDIPSEIIGMTSPGASVILLAVRRKGRNALVRMRIPESCFCPITHDIMVDPVQTYDGFTFERLAIMKWLHGSNLSPLTNLPLPSKYLKTDYKVRKTTQDFLKQYNKFKEVRPLDEAESGSDDSEVFYEYID